MVDGQTYHGRHLSRSPRSLLIKAVSFCKNKDTALDIGAGTLIESKFLLDSGFKRVVAVDNFPKVKIFAEDIDDQRLEVLIMPFKDLVLVPESYDLVTAQYSLLFYGPSGFEEFIKKIISSLKPGGVFTGQFFGIRDGWNVAGRNFAFQEVDKARELLHGLRIEDFVEKEKDSTAVSGEPKRWHVFHFIAVK